MGSSLRWTPEQLAEFESRKAPAMRPSVTRPAVAKRANKYNAKRVYFDRIWFDSLAELRRYRFLRDVLGPGSDLVVHPVFPIYIDGELIGTYEADFRYVEHGLEIVEDVKNPVTAKAAAFRRNCKMVKAQYGIDIAVVMA